MGYSIDEIYEMLSWNNDISVQIKGITEGNRIKNLSVFIMPIETKAIWENCAKILVSKSDDELSLYYFKLFQWLQDMNWPGAYLIYDRLLTVSDEDIIAAFEYSRQIATNNHDISWIKSLSAFYEEYKSLHP